MATCRATASVPPPAAHGTIRVIGRSGNAARAGPDKPNTRLAAASAATTSILMLRIMRLPICSLRADVLRGPRFLSIPGHRRYHVKGALVPRTRSSRASAASPIANFGFKRGTRIIDLLVSL